MATRGARRHLVTLSGPGVPVADGDGGWTTAQTALSPPTMYAEIKPATARDLERVAAGSVLSTASHLMTMDFHAGITLQTVVTFDGRTFSVTGKADPTEQKRELVLVCVEVVT